MDLLVPVYLFAFSSTITPGPNNIMIMTSGLNFGTRRSMPHLMGICLGFTIMVIVVGLGFGVLFEKLPILHELIKIAGVIYLLYLSWLIASASGGDESKESASQPLSFLQAASFQWVNPKAWIMASGAIAAYSSMGSTMLPQVLFIATAFLVVAFPCVGIWLYFGTALKQVLKKQQWRTWFNRVMALLLVISILPIIRELASNYLGL